MMRRQWWDGNVAACFTTSQFAQLIALHPGSGQLSGLRSPLTIATHIPVLPPTQCATFLAHQRAYQAFSLHKPTNMDENSIFLCLFSICRPLLCLRGDRSKH
jgi:hypothetical protein